MKPLIKYISILLFCGFLILPKLSPFGRALEQGCGAYSPRSVKKSEDISIPKSSAPESKNSFSFFDVALHLLPVLNNSN
jgi:hypothetical protein